MTRQHTPRQHTPRQHRNKDSLVCCSPDEVTVHGAVLQLTGGHSVQRTAESGTISRIGAIGFHTADGLTHKVTQGRLSPAAYCPIPVHHMFVVTKAAGCCVLPEYLPVNHLKKFRCCIANYLEKLTSAVLLNQKN